MSIESLSKSSLKLEESLISQLMSIAETISKVINPKDKTPEYLTAKKSHMLCKHKLLDGFAEKLGKDKHALLRNEYMQRVHLAANAVDKQLIKLAERYVLVENASAENPEIELFNLHKTIERTVDNILCLGEKPQTPPAQEPLVEPLLGHNVQLLGQCVTEKQTNLFAYWRSVDTQNKKPADAEWQHDEKRSDERKRQIKSSTYLSI